MYFRKGFTTLELMVSLFICCLCISLVSQSLTYLNMNQNLLKEQENSIALEQLKITLALAENIEIDYDMISYLYNDELYEGYFDDDRFIMTPGTVIYLTNVKEGYFEIEDRLLSIHYLIGSREVNEIIALVPEGIRE